MDKLFWKSPLLLCGYVGMCDYVEDGEINILIEFMDFQSLNYTSVNKRVIRYDNRITYLRHALFA